MLKKINEYIKTKYNLKTNLDIDLHINSKNDLSEVIISISDDVIIINYDNFKIVSNYTKIYKDITYLFNKLINIYYLDMTDNIISEDTYVESDDSLFDYVEDNLWKKRNELNNVAKVYVSMFALDYYFITNVSGSFLDTFWPIYDAAHYAVLNATLKTFKYKEPYYALKDEVIPTKINLKEIESYILKYGYAFLVGIKDDEYEIYEIINIDFSNFKDIIGPNYIIMSADYKSIIYVNASSYYIKGEITNVYKTIYKLIQVDNDVCDYIHNIHTSRVIYKNKLYESFGKSLSEELNNLNKLLDYKIMSCFTCKYGNYIDKENEIYCLKGFKYNNLTDICFIKEETGLIPYDQFNLCEDFNFKDDKTYIHSLSQVKNNK